MSLTPSTPDIPGVKGSKSGLKIGETEVGWGIVAIIAAVLAVPAVMFFATIAAWVSAALSSLIGLCEIAAILAVLSSPLWSTTVQNGFMIFRRWVHRTFVYKNPVGVLRNTVEIIRKKLTEFDQSVSQLAGSKKRIEEELQSYAAEIRKSEAMFNEARKQYEKWTAMAEKAQGNDLLEVKINLQSWGYKLQEIKASAGTNIESIRQEKPLLDATTKMYGQFCQLRTLAEFKVRSLTQRADQLERRHKSMQAGGAALMAGRRILKGDQKQDELWDMAVEALNEEAANTLGAMEDFTQWSDKYLSDMNIEQAANASEAEALFSRMETTFAIPDGTKPVVATKGPAQALPIPIDHNLLDDVSMFQLPADIMASVERK